ncbi:MAG: hypothetical protein IPM40_04000 [Gammaproteobacteria bacterium]|nr:hypothetical protein [Gammaproteobacteria bacterium]MBK9466548.1 hypothetical protein [Gammaproteobacteria bacterium]MBP7909175.1 hypothetical protein [Pseudomonadales bacterium]
MGKESLNRSDFISLASLARAFSEHYGDLGVALDVVATRVAENGAGILCLDDDGKPCRFVQEGHSDQAQFLYDLFRRADALGQAGFPDELERVGVDLAEAETSFEIPYAIMRAHADARGAAKPSTAAPTMRDSSLLAVIAALMALWPGGNSKLPSAKELERAAQVVGASVSDDAIRAAISQARAIAPGLPRA